MRSILYNRHHK
uniref:Uncharacterized protein n=1 Tax=Arundo donax TaxID=35708 RepID=A0A0A8ZQ98_ARUDO